MRVFALSYCILFSPVWLLSFGGLLFLKRKQRIWIWGRKEVKKQEEVEGGETAFWIYCVREEFTFQKSSLSKVSKLGEMNCPQLLEVLKRKKENLS